MLDKGLPEALEPSLDESRHMTHTRCMKRTNVVLDEELLEEAQRLSGQKTYSGTIELALRELVRRAKARQILALRGSGAWQGDLGEMRRDAPAARRKR